jgi:3-dehydroquinate synthase
MAEIRVSTPGGKYPVYIGRGVIERELAGDIARLQPQGAVVVSHPAIRDLHGHRLRTALQSGSGDVVKSHEFLFPQGEESKNLETVEAGYGMLLACGITREDLLLAFGGGVVGDLAGFLAATYMRGMRYVQVPTTLMAMVDSAIGGKVGVDMPGAKNTVGAFHQPRGVYSDVSFLQTLPERELRSGFAEVAKYGFLYDQKLLAMVEGWGGLPGETCDLAEVIALCAGHKARVVRADERDLKGERAMLNYGHTFGHALESACGYGRLRHGEAVAVGMIMAARLSELIGLCEGGLWDYHRCVLVPILGGGARDVTAKREAIMADMQADKKKGRSLRFVLLEGLQASRLVEAVEMRAVEAAVEETLEKLRRADPCL